VHETKNKEEEVSPIKMLDIPSREAIRTFLSLLRKILDSPLSVYVSFALDRRKTHRPHSSRDRPTMIIAVVTMYVVNPVLASKTSIKLQRSVLHLTKCDAQYII
jgi:hypothetical protein